MAKTYVKIGTNWHESTGEENHPLLAKKGHRLACTGLVAIAGEASDARPAALCALCANPDPARAKAIRDRVERRVTAFASKTASKKKGK